MIIYNVTITVEDDIKEDWLSWMKKEHIPEVIERGGFIKAQIKKVITKSNSENTFAIAYTCSNMKDLHKYQINCANNLQKKHIDRYGDKAVAFSTIMEIIEDF